MVESPAETEERPNHGESLSYPIQYVIQSTLEQQQQELFDYLSIMFCVVIMIIIVVISSIRI